MFNTPDGLITDYDPASEKDYTVVVCDQSGCMNSITIDKPELALELGTTGGVTCYECAEYEPLDS